MYAILLYIKRGNLNNNNKIMNKLNTLAYAAIGSAFALANTEFALSQASEGT
jgi:hypothetical protein